jgi:LmbE family N-acetylglucosaminyl deacetylase
MGIVQYTLQRALVLAPHADDETLGCAGVIQKYISQGSSVRTVIASLTLNDSKRYSKENIRIKRSDESARCGGLPYPLPGPFRQTALR